MNERMYLELLRLIYDSFKRKVPIDVNFLNRVGDIVIPYEELNNYVRNICMTEGESTYNLDTKSANINIKQPIENAAKDKKVILFNSFEAEAHPYSKVIIELLHELYHAKESRDLDDKKDCLETKILDASMRYKPFVDNLSKSVKSEELFNILFDLMSKRYERLNNRFWDYAPEERLAENYAYSTIISVLKLIKKKAPHLYYLNKYWLGRNYLVGYEEGLIPTKFYLEQLGFGEYYNEISVIVKNLSLQKRLELGLEITKEEFETTTDRVEKLIRRIRI